MSTTRAEIITNLAASKTVPVDTVINGTAKAWATFNGDGTIALKSAFNVSSITDNGAGSYNVNFTTPMPDANYAVVGSVIAGPSDFGITTLQPWDGAQERSTTTVRLQSAFVTSTQNRTLVDYQLVNVAIYR